MTKEELNDFIKKAKDGNQHAFTVLYEQFVQMVTYTIFGIVKNRDAADDLTSVTFTKAFLRLEKYTEDVSFPMWLKTIAVNSGIDYIRTMKKERNMAFLDDEETYIQPEATLAESVEDEFIYKELQLEAENAINSLKEPYYNVLTLRRQGKSYKEIQEELGITDAQVKSLLFSARSRLKQKLQI